MAYIGFRQSMRSSRATNVATWELCTQICPTGMDVASYAHKDESYRFTKNIWTSVLA